MFPAKRPLSYLITEGLASDENFQQSQNSILEIVSSALNTNIDLIQIREKNINTKNLFTLTKNVVELSRNSSLKILVNERADIAYCAGADGVHLTSKSVLVKEIRKVFTQHFIIGKSTHTLAEALEAKAEEADFIVLSPIFPTASKLIYGEPQGLDNLKEVCEKLQNFPVIALGGINESNVESVFKAGAAGYASITFHHQQLRA